MSAASGIAIVNGAGDSSTSVSGDADIVGQVLLGSGSDDVNFNTSTMPGITLLDGGADTDELTFDGVVDAVDGEIIVNWEVINVVGESELTLTSSLTTGMLNIESAFVDMGDGSLIESDDEDDMFKVQT